MNHITKDHEQTRQQVWVEAWAKTAQSDSCLNSSVATKYADACLKAFDERFPAPASESTIKPNTEV